MYAEFEMQYRFTYCISIALIFLGEKKVQNSPDQLATEPHQQCSVRLSKQKSNLGLFSLFIYFFFGSVEETERKEKEWPRKCNNPNRLPECCWQTNKLCSTDIYALVMHNVPCLLAHGMLEKIKYRCPSSIEKHTGGTRIFSSPIPWHSTF